MILKFFSKKKEEECTLKRVLIAGGSGLVGRYLIDHFVEEGIEVIVLSHRRHVDIPGATETYYWDPDDLLDRHSDGNEPELISVMSTVDIVINLAGASIADGRFSPDHKRRIVQSRTSATAALGQLFHKSPVKPSVWIQASAVGFYGDAKERNVDEADKPGKTFLADTCRSWEKTLRPLQDHYEDQTRFAILRIGLVLAKEAPAWQKMVQPIKLGVGGPLGSGRQWWAWVHIHDIVGAIDHIIKNTDSSGIYNMTAPNPLRQKTFTKIIAKRLKRPALIPTPKVALKVVMGATAAKELVLCSARVFPKRLESEQYEFRYPTLESALEDLI